MWSQAIEYCGSPNHCRDNKTQEQVADYSDLFGVFPPQAAVETLNDRGSGRFVGTCPSCAILRLVFTFSAHCRLKDFTFLPIGLRPYGKLNPRTAPTPFKHMSEIFCADSILRPSYFLGLIVTCASNASTTRGTNVRTSSVFRDCSIGW